MVQLFLCYYELCGTIFYTGDFQAQDIVQDLNRLLDIGSDRNASMLCE